MRDDQGAVAGVTTGWAATGTTSGWQRLGYDADLEAIVRCLAFIVRVDLAYRDWFCAARRGPGPVVVLGVGERSRAVWAQTKLTALALGFEPTAVSTLLDAARVYVRAAGRQVAALRVGDREGANDAAEAVYDAARLFVGVESETAPGDCGRR